MKKNYNSFFYVLMGVLMAVVVVESGILIAKPFSPQSSALFALEGASLMGYADEIIATCTDSKYKPSCYDQEIPKLMDVLSMEQTFEVTRVVQDKDSSFPYCHVLAHELSAREVRKDPSKWKDIVTSCPSGLCSNGCLHGGFQERFREGSFTKEEIEDITVDLKTLCERRENWNPTGLEQGSCYHALGHLSMYLAEADLPKALDICEQVGLKEDGRDWRQLCYDGSFMQIFQPLEPEDFALIEGKQPTREEVPAFCGVWEGRVQASCLSESWPLYLEEIKKPEGLVKFCSRTPQDQRDRCFNALFYVLTAQFQLDVKRITDYCSDISSDVQGTCFANAASRVIEVDYRNASKAVQLCNEASLYGKDEECFGEILFYSTYNYHPGSEEFFRLCNQLPPSWKQKCLNKSSS